MDNNTIQIKQGATLDNLFIGLFVFALGIGSGFGISIFLSIPISFVGIIILLSIKGSIIDIRTKQIKRYFDFIVLKIGYWQSIETINTVLLESTNESQTFNSRGSSTTIRTKSYDICLSDGNSQKIFLKEFVDYKEAKKCLENLAHILAIEQIDKYQIQKTSFSKYKNLRGK